MEIKEGSRKVTLFKWTFYLYAAVTVTYFASLVLAKTPPPDNFFGAWATGIATIYGAFAISNAGEHFSKRQKGE